MTETNILMRLVAMQQTLRSVVESCKATAAVCDADGAKGLAMATLMVGESIATFAKALNDYVLKEYEDESDDAV
jgi:hypothetical protein